MIGPIIAAASPWGRGAVSLVRLSGSDPDFLLRFCRPRGGFPPPRRARLCTFFDSAGDFDEGLITFFEGPRSVTGEHVAELGCHGNPLIVERLLAAGVSAGARIARPGEFTRRALLNGRIDLTRAEAVLQAIEAATPEGLRVARAGLNGVVHGLAASLRESLVDAVAELEARLDHPGEDLTLTDDRLLLERLAVLAEQAESAAATYRSGRLLVEGAVVALVGPVNAGKSSLFNALGGSERALVSPVPGTTRDVVERRVRMASVAVTLLDTVGLREDPEELEARGLEIAHRLAAEADLWVVVVPAHEPDRADEALARADGRPHVIVFNHADRSPGPGLRTNALSGEGVPELAQTIAEALVGEQLGSSALVIASARQRDRLVEFGRHVRACCECLEEGGPAVAAEELYAALERLDELTGRDTRSDVLDRLFSRFCIGK